MENYSEIIYENNIKTLNEAVNLCCIDFSHEDIINELYLNNDIKKQLCIIELKYINNQEEADILVKNLTEHSGPVREVCSFKILDLISNDNFKVFFQTKEIINSITKAITDINPSVSRNIIQTLKYINNYEYLIFNIISQINQTLDELKNITKSHSYIANKKNFNLYWNLEALISLDNKIKLTNELMNIIKKTSNSNDYTIREKTAKLIYNLDSSEQFQEEINILKNDDNIYVSKYFK